MIYYEVSFLQYQTCRIKNHKVFFPISPKSGRYAQKNMPRAPPEQLCHVSSKLFYLDWIFALSYLRGDCNLSDASRLRNNLTTDVILRRPRDRRHAAFLKYPMEENVLIYQRALYNLDCIIKPRRWGTGSLINLFWTLFMKIEIVLVFTLWTGF